MTTDLFLTLLRANLAPLPSPPLPQTEPYDKLTFKKGKFCPQRLKHALRVTKIPDTIERVLKDDVGTKLGVGEREYMKWRQEFVERYSPKFEKLDQLVFAHMLHRNRLPYLTPEDFATPTAYDSYKSQAFTEFESKLNTSDTFYEITVLEAKDLWVKDTNGSSNPYFMLQFGNMADPEWMTMVYSSAVVRMSTNPTWDRKFIIPGYLLTDPLHISLWNRPSTRRTPQPLEYCDEKDRFLGMIKLTKSDLDKKLSENSTGIWEESIALQKRSSRSHVKGCLVLRVQKFLSDTNPNPVNLSSVFHILPSYDPYQVYRDLYTKLQNPSPGVQKMFSESSVKLLDSVAATWRIRKEYRAVVNFESHMQYFLKDTIPLRMLNDDSLQPLTQLDLTSLTKYERTTLLTTLYQLQSNLLASLARFHDNFLLSDSVRDFHLCLKTVLLSSKIRGKLGVLGEDEETAKQTLKRLLEQSIQGRYANLRTQAQDFLSTSEKDILDSLDGPISPQELQFHQKIGFYQKLVELVFQDLDNLVEKFPTNILGDVYLPLAHVNNYIPQLCVDLQVIPSLVTPLVQTLGNTPIWHSTRSASKNGNNTNSFVGKDRFSQTMMEMPDMSKAFMFYKEVYKLAKKVEEIDMDASKEWFFNGNMRVWFGSCLSGLTKMAERKLPEWMNKAIEIDNFEPTSDTALYSSSILDFFTAVQQQVDFVKGLHWPDEQEEESVWQRLVEIVCMLASQYASRMLTMIEEDLLALKQKRRSSMEIKVAEMKGVKKTVGKMKVSVLKANKKLGEAGQEKIVTDDADIRVQKVTCVKINNIYAVMEHMSAFFRSLPAPKFVELMTLPPTSTITPTDSKTQHLDVPHLSLIRLRVMNALGFPCVRPYTSNAYLTFSLHFTDILVGKSKVTQQSAKPNFDQEFYLPCPTGGLDIGVFRCPSPYNLAALHYTTNQENKLKLVLPHRIGHSRIGVATLAANDSQSQGSEITAHGPDSDETEIMLTGFDAFGKIRCYMRVVNDVEAWRRGMLQWVVQFSETVLDEALNNVLIPEVCWEVGKMVKKLLKPYKTSTAAKIKQFFKDSDAVGKTLNGNNNGSKESMDHGNELSISANDGMQRSIYTQGKFAVSLEDVELRIQPFLEMLNSNLNVVFTFLSEEIGIRVVESIWDFCLLQFMDLLVPPLETINGFNEIKKKKSWDGKRVAALEGVVELLKALFYSDGDGVPLEKLTSSTPYKIITTLFRNYHLGKKELKEVFVKYGNVRDRNGNVDVKYVGILRLLRDSNENAFVDEELKKWIISGNMRGGGGGKDEVSKTLYV